MSISEEALINIERQRKLFDALDVGQKGYLSILDFQRGFRFLGLEGAYDKILETFERADLDKDEKLTFYEFVNLTARVQNTESSQHIVPEFGLFAVSPDAAPSRENPTLLSSAAALPVLLVPGLAGSTIENPSTNKKLWVNMLIMNQLINYIGATYDPASKTVNGVISPVVITEGTTGVTQVMNYMKDLVTALAASGVSAATYDWRLAPQQSTVDDWVLRVKKEVEKLRSSNSNKKVVLIAHSMGNLMTMYLFHHHKQWATDNLAAYLAVAPPFGGAGLAVHAMLAPVKFSGVELSPVLLRKFPSIAWLFPHEDTFPGKAVLKYRGTSYTADGIPSFLGSNVETSTNAAPILEHIVSSKRTFLREVPPVPTWLITCQASRTSIGIDFTAVGQFAKIEEEGDKVGDGVVPYASLHINDQKWGLSEDHKIEIPDADHNTICNKTAFITAVQEILSKLVAGH